MAKSVNFEVFEFEENYLWQKESKSLYPIGHAIDIFIDIYINISIIYIQSGWFLHPYTTTISSLGKPRQYGGGDW